MNYTNLYHSLNQHLHNNSVNALPPKTITYSVLRKPPNICKYKEQIISKLKEKFLFTDAIFENHVVYYPKHICIVEENNQIGISVIKADTTWGNNYFHFVTEVLPCALHLYNQGHKYPIITHQSVFIEPIFRFFGIDEILLHEMPNNVSKIITQPYIECGNPSPEKIELIRNTLKTKANFEKKIGIFIIRNENYRSILNSQEVLDMLKQKYNDIDWHIFNSLSIQDTIELFSKAKLIVAPHGAGLTNMLFSPSEISVIEFMDINDPNICYWHLSEMLQNKYFMIPCKTMNYNFCIDLKEVNEILPNPNDVFTHTVEEIVPLDKRL